MRHIEKNEPPEVFNEFCKTPDVCFESLSGEPKRALRRRLLEDQGYICCYCGCRIEDDEHTKIEHIKCQERYGALSLDYNNMLASCDGGEYDRANRKRPRHQSHCDAKKGDDDIPVSPLDPNVEGLITYFEDGTVKGSGSGIELIKTLGLDVKYLESRRRNIIEEYMKEPHEDLEAELNWFRSMHDGKLEEFCFVLEQCASMLVANKQKLAVAI